MYNLGKTALMIAAIQGCIQVFRYLVSKGASLEEKDDEGKMEPLFIINL